MHEIRRMNASGHCRTQTATWSAPALLFSGLRGNWKAGLVLVSSRIESPVSFRNPNFPFHGVQNTVGHKQLAPQRGTAFNHRLWLVGSRTSNVPRMPVKP